MFQWQVKLCDPLVTHGPYVSALAVVVPMITPYYVHTILITHTVAQAAVEHCSTACQAIGLHIITADVTVDNKQNALRSQHQMALSWIVLCLLYFGKSKFSLISFVQQYTRILTIQTYKQLIILCSYVVSCSRYRVMDNNDEKCYACAAYWSPKVTSSQAVRAVASLS